MGAGGSVQGWGNFLLAMSEKQLLSSREKESFPPWLPSFMLNKVSLIHFHRAFFVPLPRKYCPARSYPLKSTIINLPVLELHRNGTLYYVFYHYGHI